MNILSQSIEGKVVIVTGGTRGIGFETVKLFLNHGAKVALCGSKQETVQKALNELNKIDIKFDVIGFSPDLSNINEVKDMTKKVLQKWGTIDVLINNAGISDSKSIYEYDDDHFAKIMDINVQGVFNCSKVVAEIMKENKKGVILNTSSMVSIYGQKSGCGYPTSKFAVNGLTKSLARELGKDGIRVNAIAPGIIETDMVKALDPNIINKMAQNIPLNRLGTPEDIANAFLFLASDLASYISGAILSVDGGIVG
ncbi:SDR family NAD(P)-dependent oxidoreductase [Clostridium ihumii]|uniref:SDR family NAD(P)-dependent oxidoreductase n=1 Tax=Clostridium ihumii TaxID=1470356 RepID=UPI00058C4401|nr:SDR family NAD(P)-dependent oxidoreductase [Clostridium ihumii]